MRRGVFVTGTDTGVGKTLVACALLHALAERGLRVAPMKPVAAGAGDIPGEAANADSLALIHAAGLTREALADVTPFLFREPIAPHIAAAREARPITLAPIVAALGRLTAKSDVVVVEGVGGFHVPLGPDFDTVHLAQALNLPVVLVVGMRLGCLNHALLTVQAVAAAGLVLAGWVANMIDPHMAAAEDNVAALRERIAAPHLGRIPHQPDADSRAAARCLDVTALLP